MLHWCSLVRVRHVTYGNICAVSYVIAKLGYSYVYEVMIISGSPIRTVHSTLMLLGVYTSGLQLHVASDIRQCKAYCIIYLILKLFNYWALFSLRDSQTKKSHRSDSWTMNYDTSYTDCLGAAILVALYTLRLHNVSQWWWIWYFIARWMTASYCAIMSNIGVL